MDFSAMDRLAAIAAVVGVWMCGVTRVSSLVRGLALQTGVLGLVAAMVGAEHHLLQYYLLAAAVIALKSVAVPLVLARTADRIGAGRDPGTILNPTLALLAGCGALAAGYFLAGEFAGPGAADPAAAGMALAHLLLGMLLMLTRRLAVGQVIGFLVLENGIFLYSLTQTRGIPLMVEMGILLDVLVAVMVAGLVIFRINRSFEHIDVTRLRELRE
jgi:hydrogenase-4 component E